jgi:hypothetical protein
LTLEQPPPPILRLPLTHRMSPGGAIAPLSSLSHPPKDGMHDDSRMPPGPLEVPIAEEGAPAVEISRTFGRPEPVQRLASAAPRAGHGFEIAAGAAGAARAVLDYFCVRARRLGGAGRARGAGDAGRNRPAACAGAPHGAEGWRQQQGVRHQHGADSFD